MAEMRVYMERYCKATIRGFWVNPVDQVSHNARSHLCRPRSSNDTADDPKATDQQV